MHFRRNFFEKKRKEKKNERKASWTIKEVVRERHYDKQNSLEGDERRGMEVEKTFFGVFLEEKTPGTLICKLDNICFFEGFESKMIALINTDP